MRNYSVKKIFGTLAIAATTLTLAACGGSSSGGDSNPAESVATTPLVSNDFRFPTVTQSANQIRVDIPEGALPEFSARRTINNGTGTTLEFGDPVVLKYEMYSWSTGEMVETSADLEEAFTVRAGVADGVPEFLAESLLGRNIGDRVEIVFKAGLEDLPTYLDNSDAYVLVVDLI